MLQPHASNMKWYNIMNNLIATIAITFSVLESHSSLACLCKSDICKQSWFVTLHCLLTCSDHWWRRKRSEIPQHVILDMADCDSVLVLRMPQVTFASLLQTDSYDGYKTHRDTRLSLPFTWLFTVDMTWLSPWVDLHSCQDVCSHSSTISKLWRLSLDLLMTWF